MIFILIKDKNHFPVIVFIAHRIRLNIFQKKKKKIQQILIVKVQKGHA